MDCAQGRDAQASRPTAGEARATGVVGFLSCREATFRRELPERGEEAEAPGQLKSLGTDAFTASQDQRSLHRLRGRVLELWFY